MQTWTFPECRPPGEGPWQQEPDKAQWVDEHTGLDCLIVRVPFHGALCGYVGVPPGHPWHWRDRSELAGLVDVHDGITYSAPCDETANQPTFEHRLNASLPGREENMAAGWADAEEWMRPVYRTFGYVQDQVRHLAAQVHAVAGVV